MTNDIELKTTTMADEIVPLMKQASLSREEENRGAAAAKEQAVVQYASRLAFLANHDEENPSISINLLNISCIEEMMIPRGTMVGRIDSRPITETERRRLLQIAQFVCNGNELTGQTSMAQIIRCNLKKRAEREHASRVFLADVICKVVALVAIGVFVRVVFL